MKKSNLFFIIIIFISSILFADSAITRGPDIGEIYYIGPTVTQNEAIYYSTDFGETATCMDSISEMGKICADLTTGSLYRTRMPDVMYYSDNYGQYGSWVFRSNNISSILSGRNEGFVFNGMASHSEEYGMNFINHANNGYFGSLKAVEIDNQDNIGYVLTSQYSVYDSLWLLISFDSFENFDNQYVFNWNQTNNVYLTRGYGQGKLYALRSEYTADGSRISELWFSDNFGVNWIFKNNLLSNNLVGGRQPGELFVLAKYTQLMGEIKHTYIYHSLDYGATFTIYHPFAYGTDPYYANFEATPLEGSVPLTCQFIDLSSGDNIQSWEWDFDMDGIVDSYEQNPEYTYQDTGYYSVKLEIGPIPYEDSFIKTYYIHVTGGNWIANEELQKMNYKLCNYPNPFNPSTNLEYELPINTENAKIEIYNLKGQRIKQLEIRNVNLGMNEVSWNGIDESGKPVSSGIYFYKLNLVNSPIKKMMLLK
ncbi:MAG: FlgD immunoglobulin-like domain containing protein [Candidatus Cloacimonadales bacterium]|nr:FlgD immunoglobulin-like domain containing protein [Candidatus Cloacimonadales bacterium]